MSSSKRKLLHHIVIDSTHAHTDLCELGKVCGTDKSPYVDSPYRHRHPYTAVYELLFAPMRHKHIKFAEIGIAAGNSSLMWYKYFTNAKLFYFDISEPLFRNVTSLNLDPEPTLGIMDVSKDGDVTRALRLTGDELFDIILDDSSHVFEDQIRIIKEGWQFLKSGGYMIVEDIFRNASETSYEDALKEILLESAMAYFVVCNHEERWSPGYNNDKLLVLVKGNS